MNDSSSSINYDPCVICFESLSSPDNPVGVCTPCGHCFHMKCYEQWKVTKRRCHQVTTCPTCKQFVKEFHRICYQLDDSMKILRKTFGLLENQIEKQQLKHQQLQPQQQYKNQLLHQKQQQKQQQQHQQQQRLQQQLQQRQRVQLQQTSRIPAEAQQQQQQQQQLQQLPQQRQRVQIQQTQHFQAETKPQQRQEQQQQQKEQDQILQQKEQDQILQQQQQRVQLQQRQQLQAETQPQQKQKQQLALQANQYVLSKNQKKKKCGIITSSTSDRYHFKYPDMYSLNNMLRSTQRPHQKQDYNQIMTRMSLLQIVADAQETGTIDPNRISTNEKNDDFEEINERIEFTPYIRNECNRILYNADIVASRRNSYSSNSSATSSSAATSHCSATMLMNRTMHRRPSWQGL